MKRDLGFRLFAALAVALPLSLLAVHHALGHQGDMGFFLEWTHAFQASTAFYRDGPGLNYPILGVLLVCGPAAAWETAFGVLDFPSYRLLLKVTLTLAEILLIFALAGLARQLGTARPRLLAIGLFALPATWAGGAWFGQIDVWGSLWLTLSAWAALRYRSKGATVDLVAALLMFHAAVLTKQLTIFSLPVLGLLLILSIRGRRHFAIAAASPLVWFVADPLLILRDGWWSHLAMIFFGGGSSHGEVLSGNGANLWAWAFPDPSRSARAVYVLGVSAWTWGWSLFASVNLVFGALLVARRSETPAGTTLYGRIQRRLSDRAMIGWIGVSNLAMAVLLTGVHERYLVHGAIFIILGFCGRIRWLAVGVCGWTGLFVLSSIHWEQFAGPLSPFRSSTVTGLLQLTLLVALMARALQDSLRSRAHASPTRDYQAQ